MNTNVLNGISKIITHGATFHAGEVLAIALLRHYGCTAPVVRKFEVTEGELADEKILVLDVAKKFDPTLGNFDHHQDPNSHATNILIADWLVEIGVMDVAVLANLWSFLEYISNVDRGLIAGGGIAASFNGIIRAMNPQNSNESNAAFEVAVNLAQQIIAAQITVAERAVEDVKRWEALERVAEGKVAIQEDNNVLAGWKELAERDGVVFLVTPNPRGGWQFISRDSDQFNIFEDKRQTFRHASGFMAVYASKEDALAHACELVA